MRASQRIKRITDKLALVWLNHSDWRLGQLVSNLLGAGRQDVFYPKDEEWEKLLDEQLK